jgi:hypothetical protein
MASYITNLVINAGADFRQSFFLESPVSNSAINLTGYSAIAQIKKSPASLRKTADFSVSFPNRAVGQVTISLGSSMTSSIKPGRYSYDLLLIDPDSVKTRAVEGSIIVTAGVTTS